jgi:glycogen operon protein
VNFITAHDGFTLHDLVSYNEKHKEANGEDNRDGESNNRPWNCGVEGPTDDPKVNALRNRQKRNFLSTLFLSQGIPMLLGGDEIGRTQRATTTLIVRTTRFPGTIGARRIRYSNSRAGLFSCAKSIRCSRKWFQGRPIHGAKVTDIGWFTRAVLSGAFVLRR